MEQMMFRPTLLMTSGRRFGKMELRKILQTLLSNYHNL